MVNNVKLCEDVGNMVYFIRYLGLLICYMFWKMVSGCHIMEKI